MTINKLAFIVISVLAISSCGIKGDLFLEEDPKDQLALLEKN
jgi:predicted small lipoprotein YifL